MKRNGIIAIMLIGVGLMIYGILGNVLNGAFNKDGEAINTACNVSGEVVFGELPVPVGDLTATQTIALPDIHNNGHGWTCTGLAYDAENDLFLVGDIGKALPSSSGFASQIVKITPDFTTVKGTIDLHSNFSSMKDVQGITIDTSDDTIWFCSTSENLVRHIDATGNSLGSFSVTGSPTGIAYSPVDDSLWVLTYANSNNIKRMSKTGTTLEQYTFNYNETLDQCFLDAMHGYLYITADENYTGRNNIYLFNTTTHVQSITCTVDSYSIEGLWIGEEKMVIVNDGYYHSAVVNVNQANIYELN